jgi:hypothetical protein
MALLLLGLIDIAASSAIRAAAHAPLRAAVAMSSSNPVGGSAPNLERHNGVFDRFLLQRAVQTQIYYLNELHDRPSARFVAHFMDHAGIDSYHGFDGLRVEPEDYISHLLSSPPATVQVRASSGSVSWRQGSPGNPHLSNQKAAYHDFTVYPDRIGASLLRIRDQLADELSVDLDVLAAADEAFWARHGAGGVVAAAGNAVRHASSDTESSPTRRATFDLLQKLTLHVAVKQTLRDMSREPREQPASADGESALSPRHGWLERVFAESGFLCGDQGFGTADKFLSAMLGKESLVLRGSDGQAAAILDPHEIANQVRRTRERHAAAGARAILHLPARAARDVRECVCPPRARAPVRRCACVRALTHTRSLPPVPLAWQILDARKLLARHFKGRLAGVHQDHTDHLRSRLERSLKAQFDGPGRP